MSTYHDPDFMEGRERGRDEGAAIVRIDLERILRRNEDDEAAIAAAVREYVTLLPKRRGAA